MRILVAGGSGLIGRELVRRLIEEGHSVCVLTRKPSMERKEPSLTNLSWVTWDGKTTSGWGHLIGEMDAVINLSGANIGERRWSAVRKQTLRASRVESGQALLAALRQSTQSRASRRPSVFIQIAGVGYYGTSQTEIFDEQSPSGKDFLAEMARSWEEAANPIAELGVRYVVLRTGVVLTMKGGVMAPFLLQQRLFAGGPLGSGKQWISWIHHHDLMNCFLFMLQNETAQGIYNCTSPVPVTNAEFGRTLAKAMGRPYWIPAPAFILRLALGEMSTLVLDGQRVYPRRLLDAGFRFQFGRLKDALENLLEKKAA